MTQMQEAYLDAVQDATDVDARTAERVPPLLLAEAVLRAWTDTDVQDPLVE